MVSRLFTILHTGKVVIAVYAVYDVEMTPLKEPDDLPGAQQKALFEILNLRRASFRTSEIVARMGDAVDGRSVGGVLGSLFRNGYLEKVQGGRDKMWKLSTDAEKAAEHVKEQLKSLKSYWS